MTRRSFQFVAIILIAMLTTSAVACNGDAAGPTIRKDVMWDLTVFPQAVSLPVSESLPLTVKPLDFNGEVIDSDVVVTYKSSNDSMVSVDSMGVITAMRSTAGAGVSITVTVRVGSVTKTQYTMVGVTDVPVDVDSIAIHPLFGDPVIPVGGSGMMSVQTFDSNGTEIFNVYSLIEAVPQQGACLLFGTLLLCFSPGETMVRATVFVNGKLVSDSLTYRTRWRDYADLSVSRTPTGGFSTMFVSAYAGNIYLSPNAQVDFINKLDTPMDVIFDNPEDAKGSSIGATGGDILAIEPGRRVARWFPTTGDHFFTVRSGSDSRRVSVTVKD